MRTYAAEHLMSAFKYPRREANSLAHSCVSQRDIQVSIVEYTYISCTSTSTYLYVHTIHSTLHTWTVGSTYVHAYMEDIRRLYFM